MFFPNEKTRQEDGNLLRKEGRVVKSYYAEVNRHLEKRKCQKKTVKGYLFFFLLKFSAYYSFRCVTRYLCSAIIASPPLPLVKSQNELN